MTIEDLVLKLIETEIPYKVVEHYDGFVNKSDKILMFDGIEIKIPAPILDWLEIFEKELWITNNNESIVLYNKKLRKKAIAKFYELQDSYKKNKVELIKKNIYEKLKKAIQ